jgi:hypothetical protein
MIEIRNTGAVYGIATHVARAILVTRDTFTFTFTFNLKCVHDAMRTPFRQSSVSLTGSCIPSSQSHRPVTCHT